MKKTKYEIQNIPSVVVSNFYREKLKKYPILREEWKTLERNPYNYLKQIFTHNDLYVKEFIDLLNKEMSTFTFKDLSKDAQEYIKSQKFSKDKYKFTCYEKAYTNIFDAIKLLGSLDTTYINKYIYGIDNDFTDFFVLLFILKIDIKHIEIKVGSEFEKELFKYFGCEEGNFVEKFMRANIIVGNPPYSVGGGGKDKKNTNLDLIILEEEFFKKDTMILSYVMTARLVTRYSDEKMSEWKNKLSQYCESIHVFNGNNVFKLNFQYPLCIITLNKNKKDGSPIKVIDDIVKQEYYITHLDQYSEFGELTDAERTELKNLPNKNKKSYGKEDITCKEAEAIGTGKYFYISTSCSFNNGFITDVVSQINDDSNIINLPKDMANLRKENDKTKYREFFLYPIKNDNEGIAISKSYKQPIPRAIIKQIKNNHRICASTVDILPLPIDNNGQIKEYTNEDWKAYYNMSDSLYEKITNYYKIDDTICYK